jgi:hypothetical protein
MAKKLVWENGANGSKNQPAKAAKALFSTLRHVSSMSNVFTASLQFFYECNFFLKIGQNWIFENRHNF